MNKKPSHHSHNIGSKIKTDFLQITVKTNNQAGAIDLITALTKMKIVACAQVQGPESSIIGEEPLDWRCRFKTSTALYDQVCVETEQFFQGKPPEMICSPIVKGSEHFLKWLKTQLIN
jgi:uncharacterized protein involved in tolerance to divalent cations